MNSNLRTVSRVSRTTAQAKKSYDRMSWLYDYLAGPFERRYRDTGLRRLNIAKGEKVLEIGFGTGHCLEQMAEAVGEEGKVCGIDISSGMLIASKRRLERAGLWNRVELTCEDATKMPYPDGEFNAAFSSFALELFDSPEIPRVLAEVKRVLKPTGRIGIVSMSKGEDDSTLLSLYEWLHERVPQYVDCRPIYVEQSIRDAGFEIRYRERVSLLGLPGEIVIGAKPPVCVAGN